MCNFGKTSRVMPLVVCVMLVALAPLAQANLLPPGQTVSPDLFTAISGPTLATNTGTITAGTFTASFTTSVIRDSANVLCANCLDFVYNFTNNGPDDNGRYSMGFFTGWSTDVGITPGSRLLKLPISVDRNGIGSDIGFNYLATNQVGPGESTITLVIETNARSFKPGFLSAQDAESGSGAGFEPTVPEPSSLALLGGGLLVMGRFVRRFRLR